jgi:hypothetical protein
VELRRGAAEVQLLRDGHEVLHEAKIESVDRCNLSIDGQRVLDVQSSCGRR